MIPFRYLKKTSMCPDGLTCVSSSLRTFFVKITSKIFTGTEDHCADDLPPTWHSSEPKQSGNIRTNTWFNKIYLFLVKFYERNFNQRASTFLEQASRRPSFFATWTFRLIVFYSLDFYTSNHIPFWSEVIVRRILCCDIPKWSNYFLTLYSAKTLYRKFETNIPRNETVRPLSQFLHSCIWERSTVNLLILLQQNRWTKCGNI